MQYGVYTAAQFGAGVLAGDLAGLFHLSSDNAEGISLRPGDYGMKAALTAEVLFTFMLVLVVLAVATTQNVNNSFSGLAIGSCVAAGGLASASLSGGVFNPAVALGLMSDNFISEHDVPWVNFLFWLVAEMVGALLAAGMFFMTWRSEYKAASEYSVMENSADLAEKVLLEQETVLPEQETA
jgi:aquaporin Z